MEIAYIMSYDDEVAKYVAIPEDAEALAPSFASDDMTLYGATSEAITMGYRVTGFDASVVHLVDARLRALVQHDAHLQEAHHFAEYPQHGGTIMHRFPSLDAALRARQEMRALRAPASSFSSVLKSNNESKS